MNKSYLTIVPAIHIDDVWLYAIPHLLKGKEHWGRFYTLEQIRSNLIFGSQQLWVMLGEGGGGGKVLGVVLTQIDIFPNVKSLRIVYLGADGFKRNMMKEISRIENWAIEHGASFIDIAGREEWEPLVEAKGYSFIGKLYRKDLQDGNGWRR